MKHVDEKKHGFDWNSILDFCRKNIRYISGGIIVVILVIVLAVTAMNQDKGEQANTPNGTNEEQTGQEQQADSFAVDAIPEINTLVENYFAAYAEGDIAALEKYATPVSDIEKSYIAVMSQYVSGYENIQCHTKKGLSEGEYAVSVVMDMHFEGTETTAPGLDFFYVRQNESGTYYIDNLYSQFNLQSREQELDSQVDAYISEYEKQDDMVKLGAEVQARYEKALAADEQLKTVIETTIPEALREWVAQIAAEEGQGEAQTPAGDEQQPEDTQKPDEQQPEDTQKPDESGDTSAEEPEQNTTETVYVTSNVNVRKEPNETAEKAGGAVAGQAFTRTGTTEDGWSQIEFEGGKAYVKSEYLSTEKPAQEPENNQGDDASADSNTGNEEINFVPEGKVLTLNVAMNVRKGMDENAERIGTAEIGDTVKVVLSYAEGWTKVEWKDKTGYIKTELLLNN